MSKKYDVIIVGGGVAGLTAAIYSARAGVKTCVIENMYPGGQMATTSIVENYPGFLKIDGAELANAVLKQAENCGAEIIYGAIDVDSIDLQNKKLKVNGELVDANAVILATGAKPRLLGVENEEKLSGRGVSYCATCDGALYKGKNVVIVGGGNSAVEEAIYLSSIAKTVNIVHRRGEYRATQTEIDKLNQVNNIVQYLNCVVQELHGKKSLEQVVIRNIINEEKHIIDAQGIFVAIGRMPNSEIFASLNKDAHGYIITDNEMLTNIDGVYAVGDVRTKNLRQIVTAAADGAIAGNNAAKYALNKRGL